MKGTAAVLGACLTILAVVDAISVSRLSVSNFNADWVKIEPDPPNDTPGQVVKDLVQNAPGRLSTGVHPYSNVDDKLLYRSSPRTKPETASLRAQTPQQYDVDSTQRKSSGNDPNYVTLKVKVKLRLRQADQSDGTKVFNPNDETVIDKEFYPSQPSDENSPLDPIVESYDRIYQASKNIPEHVKNKWPKNVETLQHSSRIPLFNAQQSTKEATEDRLEMGGKNSRDEPEDQMKLSDPYYFENKPLQDGSDAKLYDEIHKISNNPQLTFSEYDFAPSLLSQFAAKDHVKISDTVNSAAEPEKVQDEDMESYYDAYRSRDHPKHHFADLRTSKFSAEEPELEPYVFGNKPRVSLYEILRGLSRKDRISGYGTNSPWFQHMLGDQIKASDLVDSKSESKNLGDHTVLHHGAFNFPEIPQRQIDPSNPADPQSEFAKSDKDTRRGSQKVQQKPTVNPTNSSLSDELPEPSKKPFDSHSSDNRAKQNEPHAELYDRVHKASKALKYLVRDIHKTKPLSETEVSKNGPKKDDELTKLFHDSNQSTRIPEEYSANPATFSKIFTDKPEAEEIKPKHESSPPGEIKSTPEEPIVPRTLSDPTKAFPEPRSIGQVPVNTQPTLPDPNDLGGSKKQDNEVKNERRSSDLPRKKPPVQLFSKKIESERSSIDELNLEPEKPMDPLDLDNSENPTKALPEAPSNRQPPMDTSEYQRTLSDPNDLENSKKQDTELSYEDRSPQMSPDSSWYSGRYESPLKTTEDNDRYTNGRPGFLSKVMSWLYGKTSN